jgi:hypothetical protein
MKIALILIWLGLPTVLIAGSVERMETLTLKHRMADELLPVLRPLLSRDDAMTAFGNQIIVRTSEATLKDLKQLLTTLDRPLRNLIISVRDRHSGTRSARGYALSGRVSIGNDTRLIPGKSTPGRADLRVQDKVHSTRRNNVHQVRVVEGQGAFIRSGKLVPYNQGGYVVHPAGIRRRSDVQFKDVSSGFFVVPRLKGDIVTLAIAPRYDELNPHAAGTIDTRQLRTVTSGRLGEWLTIGQAVRTIEQDAGGILYQTDGDANDNYRIEVKVELVKD